MTKKYLELESKGATLEELEYLTLGALRKAVQEGDMKNGSVIMYFSGLPAPVVTTGTSSSATTCATCSA